MQQAGRSSHIEEELSGLEVIAMETELTAHQTIHHSESPAEPPSRKLAILGVAGLSAVFLVSLLISLPEREYFTICGFKNLTGLPCPGCGLTHSFCALGKGDVGGAFGFNLMGPPLFFALILLWIRSACVLLNRTAVVERMDRFGRRFNIVKAFAISFAVYGIARIVYLLAYHPDAVRESPLSHLIARLIP